MPFLYTAASDPAVYGRRHCRPWHLESGVYCLWMNISSFIIFELCFQF